LHHVTSKMISFSLHTLIILWQPQHSDIEYIIVTVVSLLCERNIFSVYPYVKSIQSSKLVRGDVQSEPKKRLMYITTDDNRRHAG
jgi:hypothetical protein